MLFAPPLPLPLPLPLPPPRVFLGTSTLAGDVSASVVVGSSLAADFVDVADLVVAGIPSNATELLDDSATRRKRSIGFQSGL